MCQYPNRTAVFIYDVHLRNVRQKSFYQFNETHRRYIRPIVVYCRIMNQYFFKFWINTFYVLNQNTTDRLNVFTTPI